MTLRPVDLCVGAGQRVGVVDLKASKPTFRELAERENMGSKAYDLFARDGALVVAIDDIVVPIWAELLSLDNGGVHLEPWTMPSFINGTYTQAELHISNVSKRDGSLFALGHYGVMDGSGQVISRLNTRPARAPVNAWNACASTPMTRGRRRPSPFFPKSCKNGRVKHLKAWIAVATLVACAGTKGTRVEEPVHPVAETPTETTTVETPAPEPAPIAKKKMDMVMTPAAITVGGAEFTNAATVAMFEALFGKPDRTEEKVSRLHVYDKLGLVLYEPYNGSIMSMTIFFWPETYSFTPKTMYPGTVTVAGHVLDRNIKFDELGKVPGMVLKQSFSTTYNYAGRGYSLFISKDDSGKFRNISVTFKRSVASIAKTHPMDGACRAGKLTACWQVSLAFSEGIGVAKNATKGFEFARKACDLNHEMSCFTIALSYATGRGVTKSIPKARRAYKKSCKLGNQLACQMAGKL